MQAILRTALANGATSLAFPSLGVGALHFPADVSAKALFDEIVEFHARNPGVTMKSNIVVFDGATYQEFSKEYARKMGSTLPQRVVSIYTCAYEYEMSCRAVII